MEARRKLGPAPELHDPPLVSIVVLNRDGAAHLRRLLDGLGRHTDYPALELILVDNASGDESVELARTAEAELPIAIVANHHNESFSDACNQGAALASGPLLLFLNNDVEPFEAGWLRELVACLQARDAGLVGATLLRPDERSAHGYSVQHRAIRLRDEAGLLHAELLDRRAEPLGPGLGEDVASPVPAGACMLIERDLFHRVGGFTHGFLYGGEDIDLGFKVLAEGRSVLCCGRSLLIHRLGSTRRRTDDEQQRAIRRGNRRLLWERWGPRVRREYELDRLAGGGFWAASGQPPRDDPTREEVLALGFCLKSAEQAAPVPTEDPLEALRGELARRGHRHTVLRGKEIDDWRGLNYDVAVHLAGPVRYIPKPAQLNVLWIPSPSDAPAPIERSRYDLVVTGAAADSLCEAVLAKGEELEFPTRVRSSP